MIFSRGQKKKNITKIKLDRLFLKHFWFHFLSFLAQKLIYTVN